MTPAVQVPLTLLPAMGQEDDAADVDCPRCAACVLGSDLTCAQCGLGREQGVEQVAVPPADVTVKPDERVKRPRWPGLAPRITFNDEPNIVKVESFKNNKLWWKEAELTKPTLRSRRRSPTRSPEQAPAPASSPSCSAVPDAYIPPGNMGPWHGGTLVPPPYMQGTSADSDFAREDDLSIAAADVAVVAGSSADGAAPPIAPAALDSDATGVSELLAGQAGPDKKNKRAASGYQAWVRANGLLIRRSMSGHGLKAFGAAAGRLWRAMSQTERDGHAVRARDAAEPPEVCEAQPAQVEPQPPEVPRAPDALSPAQLLTAANNRARALARRAEAVLRPQTRPNPEPSTHGAGTQTPPAPPSTGQNRLEAVRARVRARIAAAANEQG